MTGRATLERRLATRGGEVAWERKINGRRLATGGGGGRGPHNCWAGIRRQETGGKEGGRGTQALDEGGWRRGGGGRGKHNCWAGIRRQETGGKEGGRGTQAINGRRLATGGRRPRNAGDT